MSRPLPHFAIMAAALSRRDLGVLEKIKDPESNTAAGSLLDESLPKDPNVTDQEVYERVSRKEREIVMSMQQLEIQLAKLQSQCSDEIRTSYQAAVSELGTLIAEYPDYASARNNRVQAMRRLYGDHLLMKEKPEDSQALLSDINPEENTKAASTVLNDLDSAIALLSPRSLFAGLSPTAAKTLSLAYTQRAAIYLATSKLLGSGALHVGDDRKEREWSVLDFEEAASRDFAMGGRYGNDIAKGLAVATNPTAKLCGQMVREMMRKEYEGDFMD